METASAEIGAGSVTSQNLLLMHLIANHVRTWEHLGAASRGSSASFPMTLLRTRKVAERNRRSLPQSLFQTQDRRQSCNLVSASGHS